MDEDVWLDESTILPSVEAESSIFTPSVPSSSLALPTLGDSNGHGRNGPR